MPFGLGFFATTGAGAAANSFELIETAVLSTNATDVYFDTVPSTYRHLQIRISTRNSTTFSTALRLRPNYDSNFNYWTHRLGSGGSSVNATNVDNTGRIDNLIQTSSAPTGSFGVAVIDILDASSTTKFKTIRALHGYTDPSANAIQMTSIQWRSTSAINSFWLNCWDGSFLSGSRFSLYGIKA